MIDAKSYLPRTRPARILVAILLALTVTAAGWVVRDQLTGLPDDAVLQYGDTVVSTDDFRDRVDTLGALYGMAEPEDAKERDSFRRDVAKSIAVGLMLDDAAAERGIVISEKAARDTLASMLEAQLGPNPRQEFDKLLADFGVNEADILEEVRRQQAIARLFREVAQQAVDSVTVETARSRYDADPTVFATPEQRELANIVVARRSAARALFKELKAGADFASLAGTESLDDATKGDGGLLGLVVATDLDPGYSTLAFEAQDGALFGPVKSQYGWNVGKVLRVVPARNNSFANVKADVVDLVRSERAMAAWEKWLAELLNDADVEYADDYLPKHPDAPPAETTPTQSGQP